LRKNGTGFNNTACGAEALHENTASSRNTASGALALRVNTGANNAALGYFALGVNTSGYNNVAVGRNALDSNTTGNRNIALGESAGGELTTGSNNIMIGNFGVAGESSTIRMGIAGVHTRAFLAGIRGTTTGVANAIPVLIDSSGQLGTTSSSRRFKEEIRDMGDATERLLALRPVTFRYKPEVQAGDRPLEYGLIAEEVAEAFPDLVVYDDDGRPFTVKYHLLSSMLLNELQKLHARLESSLAERARAHDALEQLESLRSEVARLRGLEARLAAVESRAFPAGSAEPSSDAR
jgi:hypothetical protein